MKSVLLGRSVPSYQDLFTNIIIVQYFLCSEVKAGPGINTALTRLATGVFIHMSSINLSHASLWKCYRN